jgi:hypothetical protein
MRRFSWSYFLPLFLLQSCIGEDLINDFVDERVTIVNPIDSLEVGKTYTFQARFFNNAGLENALPIKWSSSDPLIASVTDQGLVTGLKAGPVKIIAKAQLTAEKTVADTVKIQVANKKTSGGGTTGNTVLRSGTIRSTSNYALKGDFSISRNATGNLVISLSEFYVADTNLPGLYVYLTNNPSTAKDAYEIGKVTVFKGAHSYVLPTSIELNSYSHILYWCKPFSVKVGDGAIK